MNKTVLKGCAALLLVASPFAGFAQQKSCEQIYQEIQWYSKQWTMAGCGVKPPNDFMCAATRMQMMRAITEWRGRGCQVPQQRSLLDEDGFEKDFSWD